VEVEFALGTDVRFQPGLASAEVEHSDYAAFESVDNALAPKRRHHRRKGIPSQPMAG
jgi:hypothetical protein